MIQRDIYRALAETQGLTYRTACLIVQTFFRSIREAILEGRPVEIRGLGTWQLRRREQFLHADPRTHVTSLRNGYMVRYRPGKKLNRLLDKSHAMRCSVRRTD